LKINPTIKRAVLFELTDFRDEWRIFAYELTTSENVSCYKCQNSGLNWL